MMEKQSVLDLLKKAYSTFQEEKNKNTKEHNDIPVEVILDVIAKELN